MLLSLTFTSELIYFPFIRFAEKNNLPVLEYVTLPRVGAMKAIADVLGPSSSSNNNSTTKSPMNGNIVSSTTDSNKGLISFSLLYEFVF